MSIALSSPSTAERLRTAVEHVRGVLPRAGCAVPASALADREAARWVAAHGMTVIAAATADVHALCRHGIRPVQVILHCNSGKDPIRRAVTAGVSRFVADGEESLAAITEFSHGRVFVYLDVTTHLPELPRRIEVVGAYRRVDESDGRTGWSAAVLESLCRTAFLRSCGFPPARMVLAGDAARMVGTDGPQDMGAVASVVDEALVEGCRTWRLPRPAVTLAGVDTTARPSTEIIAPRSPSHGLTAA